jgi:four helix bundle protein
MAHTAAANAGVAPALEVERLDVYRVAREFEHLACALLPKRGCAGLRDQLLRASSSIVLNIAEGCGRFAAAEKAHFYLIARGSAMECVAAMDLLASRGLVSPDQRRHAAGLLTRVVQMLTKLARRMQSRPPVPVPVARR